MLKLYCVVVIYLIASQSFATINFLDTWGFRNTPEYQSLDPHMGHMFLKSNVIENIATFGPKDRFSSKIIQSIFKVTTPGIVLLVNPPSESMAIQHLQPHHLAYLIKLLNGIEFGEEEFEKKSKEEQGKIIERLYTSFVCNHQNTESCLEDKKQFIDEDSSCFDFDKLSFDRAKKKSKRMRKIKANLKLLLGNLLKFKVKTQGDDSLNLILLSAWWKKAEESKKGAKELLEEYYKIVSSGTVNYKYKVFNSKETKDDKSEVYDIYKYFEYLIKESPTPLLSSTKVVCYKGTKFPNCVENMMTNFYSTIFKNEDNSKIDITQYEAKKFSQEFYDLWKNNISSVDYPVSSKLQSSLTPLYSEIEGVDYLKKTKCSDKNNCEINNPDNPKNFLTVLENHLALKGDQDFGTLEKNSEKFDYILKHLSRDNATFTWENEDGKKEDLDDPNKKSHKLLIKKNDVPALNLGLMDIHGEARSPMKLSFNDDDFSDESPYFDFYYSHTETVKKEDWDYNNFSDSGNLERFLLNQLKDEKELLENSQLITNMLNIGLERDENNNIFLGILFILVNTYGDVFNDSGLMAKYEKEMQNNWFPDDGVFQVSFKILVSALENKEKQKHLIEVMLTKNENGKYKYDNTANILFDLLSFVGGGTDIELSNFILDKMEDILQSSNLKEVPYLAISSLVFNALEDEENGLELLEKVYLSKDKNGEFKLKTDKLLPFLLNKSISEGSDQFFNYSVDVIKKEKASLKIDRDLKLNMISINTYDDRLGDNPHKTYFKRLVHLFKELQKESPSLLEKTEEKLILRDFYSLGREHAKEELEEILTMKDKSGEYILTKENLVWLEDGDKKFTEELRKNQ